MVGQCHRSDQDEFDQTLGGGGRQEGLACSGPWGHEELDMTQQLNNNNNKEITQIVTQLGMKASFLFENKMPEEFKLCTRGD